MFNKESALYWNIYKCSKKSKDYYFKAENKLFNLQLT